MGTLFLLLIIIVVAVGFFLSVVRGLTQWNRNYRILGNRYAGKQANGGVMYGFFLTTPALLFNYGQTFCVLKSRRSLLSRSKKYTALSIKWPDTRLKVQLDSPPAIRRTWGYKPVSLAETQPTFRQRFSCHSSQPEIAIRMLSQRVEYQLEQLRILGDPRGQTGEIKVAIQRGELVISKPGYLKELRLLEDFLRLGLELHDQMMLVYANGIDFVSTESAVVCVDVKCPICSEQIEHEMVFCPRCKTPHCLDCWEYNGQCATYACQETRYQRVAS